MHGNFMRSFPELVSADDNGGGIFCTPLVELSGDFGTGNDDSST